MPIIPPTPGSTSSIATEIADFLLENSEVAAIVGDRVWLTNAPEETAYPLLVYTMISAPRTDEATDTNGIVDARWQFSAYSRDAVEARQITDAVKAALLRYRGLLAPNGAFVEVPSVEDERGPEYTFETQVYRCDVDLIISYPD
jgi:hypothetical protein